MSKKTKVPDGRFDGDRYVLIHHNPYVSLPWRVMVFEWTWKWGGEDRKQRVYDWWEIQHFLNADESGYCYKRLSRALRRREKIMRKADTEAIEQSASARAERNDWKPVL